MTWYNTPCLDVHKPGRFAFINAVTQHNNSIVGKAPLVSGLASRCTSRQRRQANKGRFVMITDDYGYWFAGLTDGEGCFHARVHIRKSDGARCLVVYFSLKMRADDFPMLESIKNTLGVGNIYFNSEKLSRHKQADYRVNHRDDLKNVLIPTFDKYPLRSKKGKDYKIWRELVLDYKCAPRQQCRIGVGSLSNDKWRKAQALSELLRANRAFEIDPTTAAKARERVLLTQPPLLLPEPVQLELAR